MSGECILAVNGGSSTLKCGVFAAGEPNHALRRFSLRNTGGTLESLVDRLHQVLGEIARDDSLGAIAAVGHRVVHGGPEFDAPVVIDDEVFEALRELISLAPLHQPANLSLIEACQAAMSDIRQVACFDTAFHRTLPSEARHYALPRKLTEEGFQAYGFHGLSNEYICRALRESGERIEDKRIIIAHLGAGASLCAIQNGESIATTMGFSPLDGLPMATRTGSIDPGLIIHLVRERHMSADDLEQLLNKDSGLLGISGISGDMQELRKSDNPSAREAVDYFVYRTAREIGSLTAALGGLDLLVFTGGIGANDEDTRNAIVESMGWLAPKPEITVMQTDEEAMIAQHTRRVTIGGSERDQV